MRLLWVILVLPTLVQAATYFVRPGGSDGHGCAEATVDRDGTAKGSMQGGINCARGPRDTIIVHGGTYGRYGGGTEIPSVSGSNLGSGAITLQAAPGETVWLRGGLDMWNHAGEYWVIKGINIDGGHQTRNTLLVNGQTRIQDLEVKNSFYYGIAFGGAGSEAINIRSHHHGTGPRGCTNGSEPGAGQCHGIYSHLAARIVGGEYTNNNGWGVSAVYLKSGAVHICHARLSGNAGGIQYLTSPEPALIVGNTITNNAGNALWLANGTFRLSGNTIAGNGDDAVLNTGGASITAEAGVGQAGDVCNRIGDSGPGPSPPPLPRKPPGPKNRR